MTFTELVLSANICRSKFPKGLSANMKKVIVNKKSCNSLNRLCATKINGRNKIALLCIEKEIIERIKNLMYFLSNIYGIPNQIIPIARPCLR